MDLGLKDQVVLVAGASKGLGYAIARGFAAEGANVSICSRNRDHIETAAQMIQSESGREVFANAIDLTKRDEIIQWVQKTQQKFGKINVCITNVGGPPSQKFMQTTDESWHKAIDLTLMTVVNLSQAVVPYMQAERQGRLIHICSASVKNPIPHLIFSNAIRAAVVALSKTQANELGEDNILVNCVLPGWTNTERVTELLESHMKHEGLAREEVIKRRTATIPLKRMGQPDEIAAPVVFLASNKASFVTGTVLTIDGGETKYPF